LGVSLSTTSGQCLGHLLGCLVAVYAGLPGDLVDVLLEPALVELGHQGIQAIGALAAGRSPAGRCLLPWLLVLTEQAAEGLHDLPEVHRLSLSLR
jgi:hypothetical protein